MKKVLVFGGAFNPPTIAHLEAARTAMRSCGREGVVFVPSQSVYIEKEQQKDFAFSNEDRLALLEACTASHSWMKVCPYELLQKTQPRTYQTLCYLRDAGFSPSLLIGSDKLPELEHGWKFIPQIAEEFGIVCMDRGNGDTEAYLQGDEFLSSLGQGLVLVQMPGKLHSISSTQVRQALCQGDWQKVSRMVPPETMELLKNITDRENIGS